MMLAIDIGNSKTKLGIFTENKLISKFVITTDTYKTSDEYKIIINNLFVFSKLDFNKITDVVISSVVPLLDSIYRKIFEDKKILFITHNLNFSFKLSLPIPSQMGADRLANVEAAITKYGYPLIIVDSGTATTFCAINDKKEYLGGAISPGFEISYEALVTHAAKLKKEELNFPKKAIGNTTKTNLESGLILGYASLINGMINLFKKELNLNEIKVVGTGGAVMYLKEKLSSIDIFDEHLALEGLYYIWKKYV
jgi:type III pantothenate kinase